MSARRNQGSAVSATEGGSRSDGPKIKSVRLIRAWTASDYSAYGIYRVERTGYE